MRASIKIFNLILLTLALLCSCNSKPQRLPLLGNAVLVKHGTAIDSVYPVVPTFSFIDQKKKVIDNNTFRNKIYVADFFFISCPTICPVMTASMKRVYDAYAQNKDILFISHTIDPKYDTPERLDKYADGLNADHNKWHFVTGNRDSIYKLAEKGYYSPAHKDTSNQGGYVHSGGLILIDKQGHMRGVYDGTSKEETNKLIEDIEVLIKQG
jgi:protein SCO1/2